MFCLKNQRYCTTLLKGFGKREYLMDAQYYARFNELIDKLAIDSMTADEQQEYQLKRTEILNEKINGEFNNSLTNNSDLRFG